MSTLSSTLTALKRLSATPATREGRNVRRLMAHTALFGIVNGGVIAFLPILLARLGAAAVTVGLLTSLPALVTILVALPAAGMVMRWRDLVRMSARCFYLLRLSYPPIAAAAVLLDPALAPWLIVIIWGLTAIPGTLGNTVFYDVLAEAVPPRRRARVNGLRWALLGMLSAVSVSLFGQALERLPWPANYLLLFAICFAAGIASTWFYSRLEIPLREPAPPSPAPDSLRARLAELVEPFRNGSGFFTFSLVTFVLRLGLFLPSGVFSIFLVRSLGVSDAWIGGRLTLENVALTVGYYFWGRMANRLGHARLLILAALAGAGAYALVSATTPATIWFLLVTALVWGFFASSIDISLFEWLLEVMPADERPRYVALNTLLMNLVASVGPVAGAAIADRAGIPAVFRCSGAALLACALLTYAFARAPRPLAPAKQQP